jgi:hypothetical protein
MRYARPPASAAERWQASHASAAAASAARITPRGSSPAAPSSPTLAIRASRHRAPRRRRAELIRPAGVTRRPCPRRHGGRIKASRHELKRDRPRRRAPGEDGGEGRRMRRQRHRGRPTAAGPQPCRGHGRPPIANGSLARGSLPVTDRRPERGPAGCAGETSRSPERAPRRRTTSTTSDERPHVPQLPLRHPSAPGLECPALDTPGNREEPSR